MRLGLSTIQFLCLIKSWMVGRHGNEAGHDILRSENEVMCDIPSCKPC